MNTVSRQASPESIVSFSKVVNRPHATLGDERISIVIRSTESAVEVGLLNHALLDGPGVDKAILGLKLPAGADGPAFVEDFVAAYVAKPTFGSMLFGWYTPVFDEYHGGFDQSVEHTMAAHFTESGEITREQFTSYQAESAERLQRCADTAAGLN